jgi:hypothetical protein
MDVPSRYEDDLDDTYFSRTLVIGVIYGLIAWFHLILCPAYVVAGLLPDRALHGYPIGAEAWASVYIVTGGVMLAVALGLVAERGWAWRIAPWAVLPNLLAHLVLIFVLPLWGATAIASDVVAIWLVVGERRRQQAALARRRGASVAHGRDRTTRVRVPLVRNRRPT